MHYSSNEEDSTLNTVYNSNPTGLLHSTTCFSVYKPMVVTSVSWHVMSVADPRIP